MSNLKLFMKKNKKARENVKYAATKSLCDENGTPLEWEIRPLTTNETEEIRASVTTDVPVKGKPGMYRQKMDGGLYAAKIIAASVVFPDLYNKELQDSYGVTTPEALIREMIDSPAEYNALGDFVQKLSGIGETMEEKVDEAKN